MDGAAREPQILHSFGKLEKNVETLSKEIAELSQRIDSVLSPQISAVEGLGLAEKTKSAQAPTAERINKISDDVERASNLIRGLTNRAEC